MITINSGIDLEYTPKMEKAMQQSHGMSYKEYERKFDKRIVVEKRREQEYKRCKHMAASFDQKIYK